MGGAIVSAGVVQADRYRSLPWRYLLPVAGVALSLAWVYWPSLTGLVGRWGDAEYSHGYLVPVFSLYLLWFRRGLLPAEPLRPSWWGLPVLAAGLALRFAGTYAFFDWLAAVALLPCLAGVALLAGGGRALRWSWPAIAFLVFMIPLPHRLETGLAQPLQHIATKASTYALQTLGFAAFAEGNVIRMGEVRIGVVEACSGLSMLIIFFALATAVILVVRRPPLDKGLIFVSALPIALAANLIRITVTGVLHKVAGSRLADLVFHDLAGWLMMPLALGLLWVELRLLAWVLVPAAEPKPLAMGPAGPKAPPRRAAGRRPKANTAP
jgi:exosortase